MVGDDHPGQPEVPLFRPGTARPALLRFSRGAGLPEPLPDALGVAVKLPDAYGPGNDQDLLLTSSTDRPLLRRLLFPATSFVRGVFSTALPYDLGGKRVVLLLVPAHTGGASSAGTGIRRGGGALAELNATAGGLRFELRTASSFGPSQPVATLTTGQPYQPSRPKPCGSTHGPPGRVFDQPAGSTPARHRLQSKPTRPAVLTIAAAQPPPTCGCGWSCAATGCIWRCVTPAPGCCGWLPPTLTPRGAAGCGWSSSSPPPGGSTATPTAAKSSGAPSSFNHPGEFYPRAVICEARPRRRRSESGRTHRMVACPSPMRWAYLQAVALGRARHGGDKVC